MALGGRVVKDPKPSPIRPGVVDKTPRVRDRNPDAVRDLDRLKAAAGRINAAGLNDPTHYWPRIFISSELADKVAAQNGTVYCLCGTTTDHNKRFDELAEGQP